MEQHKRICITRQVERMLQRELGYQRQVASWENCCEGYRKRHTNLVMTWTDYVRAFDFVFHNVR